MEEGCFERLIKHKNSSTTFEDDVTQDSPIKDYLFGKTVFLTGGFGFLGKLLIEKLLRCRVKRIYLLARPKKGKSIEERLETLKQERFFETFVNDKEENHFAKLTLIYGDLQKLALGISASDQQNLISDVEIVLHAAADVRFDESLREATEINVRGTREILVLSRKMLNLNTFIYVSTAYATPAFEVKEKFYRSALDPDFMIRLMENLSPDEYESLEVITRRIIQPFPNTYTYTKALAEHVVRKHGKHLNVAIFRPSIIATTYNEPVAGYTDNLYGVNGIVTGAGMGLLRILLIENSFLASIVPADYVINGILALAWFTSLQNNNNFVSINHKDIASVDERQVSYYHDFNNETAKIYHCAVTPENPVTWADVKTNTTVIGDMYPSKRMIWIIRYNTTRYRWIFQILKIFYHFIPALLVDTVLQLKGKQPRLLKIYRKIDKFCEVIELFTTNEWIFSDTNMKEVHNAMTPFDRKFFQCNIAEIDWRKFLVVFADGLRKNIVKDDKSSLEDARKRYRRMTIIHYLLIALIYSCMAMFAYQILKIYGFDIDHVVLNFRALTQSLLARYDDA